MGKDNIVVLADNNTLPYLRGKLPEDILLEAEIQDIWMRDFTTVLPSKMIQFVYDPSDKSAIIYYYLIIFNGSEGADLVKTTLIRS